jgi:hypothetical protein
MKSSESIKALAEALCKAQSEMGGAVKESANPFFKSSYADLTSVIKAIKEPFAKNGLSYTQFPISNEYGVGVATRLMHNSGEWIEEEFVLPLVKRDPQSGGSCLTYCRRYSLQSLAGIPSADDDAESAMLRGNQDEKINESSVLEIAQLIHETASDEKKFCELFGVNNLSAIKVSQYDRAITMLKAKKARK